MRRGVLCPNGGDGEEEEKPEAAETPALPPEEGTIESKPEDGDTPDIPSGDGDPEEPEE